jgi:biopolymer transport protein ExbB/TolQ
MYDGGQFLTHMLQNASLPVECSLIVLFLMFLWTLVDVVVRSVRYYSATRQSHRFLEASAGLLERGQWKGVQSIAETLNRSHVAMVYFNAMQEFRTAHECVLAEQAVEAARRGARTARNRVHEQLRQGLSYLSAIAITAPLVGLFGTTIGILDSFGAYIGSRNGFIAFIAANLADALVPTATGLLVGVLATWCFNCRNDQLATFDVEMEIAELDLVKHLKQQASFMRA